MSWTITNRSGLDVALSLLKLSEPRLTLRNQAADELTLQANLSLDDEPIWDQDQLVTLKQDGVIRFVGRAQSPQRSGRAQQEGHSITILGPWHDLEMIIYEQFWKSIYGFDKTGAPQYRFRLLSRAIFFANLVGGKIGTADVCKDALSWAIASGAYLQLGKSMVNLQVPLQEQRDRNVAEVVRGMLAWQPSAVAWFDYSVTPPRLNVTDRSLATPVNYNVMPTGSVPGAPYAALESIELRRRDDLRVDGVQFKYVIRSQIGNATVLDIQVDAAGQKDDYDFSLQQYTVGIPPVNRLRLLKMSFDLDGGSIKTPQKQAITTQKLPTDFTEGAGNNNSLWWWKSHEALGFLDYCTNVLIEEPDVEIDKANEKLPVGVKEEDCHEELIEGQIATWMLKKYGVVPTKVTALLSADYDDGSGTTQRILKRRISVNYIATNVTTGEYNSPDLDPDPGEPVPSGLAQQFFASVNQLQWDGTFTLVEQECSFLPLGRVINLAGTRTEYAKMNAQIQELTYDINLGSTTIKVGPAGHLSPENLVALMKPIRIHNTPPNPDARTKGTTKASSEAQDVLGQLAKKNANLHPTLAGEFQPWQVIPADDGQLPSDNRPAFLKVLLQSDLLQPSGNVNDKLSITGLDTPIAVAVGQYVWLEIAFNASGEPTGASIKTGTTWSGFPAMFAVSGATPPKQTAFYQPLAKLVASTSTLPGLLCGSGKTAVKIIQLWQGGHMRLIQVARNGTLLYMPEPSQGSL